MTPAEALALVAPLVRASEKHDLERRGHACPECCRMFPRPYDPRPGRGEDWRPGLTISPDWHAWYLAAGDFTDGGGKAPHPGPAPAPMFVLCPVCKGTGTKPGSAGPLHDALAVLRALVEGEP